MPFCEEKVEFRIFRCYTAILLSRTLEYIIGSRVNYVDKERRY